MTGDTTGQATSGIEAVIERLRGSSLKSRREFLERSAMVGGSALALSVVGSNAVLAHDGTDDDMSDVDVLNYALTLEHLENAFYREGIERFDNADFMQADTLERFGAGVRRDVREHLSDIGEHEQAHVDTLTKVIESFDADPVSEAKYKFGIDNVDEFLTIAGVLENTGVSAYDGAIHMIDAEKYLTAGATIATVEARHASYLNFLNGKDPFPRAFDEPKTPEEVLEAAGGFIADDCN